MTSTPPRPDVPVAPDAVQPRVVRTLVLSQMLGGVGLSMGAAVSSLIGADLSGGEAWAGLGGTFQTAGAAAVAVPMAHVMAAKGRRPGLVMGFLIAAAGAAGIIASTMLRSFPLFLLASVLVGASTAAISQSRYAAADLADPARRARDLSIVVWAVTVGSVAGPTLAGPLSTFGPRVGVPPLAGPYLASVAGLALAALVVWTLLRPDPLLEARRRAAVEAEAVGEDEAAANGSVIAGLRVALGRPGPRLGILSMALGYAVMVGVMVMTPIHMTHGAASLTVIGIVISIHVLGMFAFSPLVGMAADRFGGRAVTGVGALILMSAAAFAASAPQGESTRLVAGLFLLGLGWSFTLIGGSALLTGGIDVADRAAVQGGADMISGLSAGTGGVVSGLVMAQWGFAHLSVAAFALAAVLGLLSLRTRIPRLG